LIPSRRYLESDDDHLPGGKHYGVGRAGRRIATLEHFRAGSGCDRQTTRVADHGSLIVCIADIEISSNDTDHRVWRPDFKLAIRFGDLDHLAAQLAIIDFDRSLLGRTIALYYFEFAV